MVNKTKEITFNGLQEDSYWKIFWNIKANVLDVLTMQKHTNQVD
jgi:hypothetical protein